MTRAGRLTNTTGVVHLMLSTEGEQKRDWKVEDPCSVRPYDEKEMAGSVESCELQGMILDPTT